MRIKNNLTPYPILSNNNDTFLESSFTTTITGESIFNQFVISGRFHLNNLELLDLIASKKVSYVVHVECPSASYRYIFEDDLPDFSIRINDNEIREKVEVCTFLISKEVIDNYSNSKFHPDYLGYEFKIEPGNILAIGSAMEFFIKKNCDELENLPSIIKIFRLDDKEKNKGTMSVNTDDPNKIFVGLYADQFDQYCQLGQSLYKETLFSMILLPALITILARMKNDPETYEDRTWFQVIDTMLEKNKCSLENLTYEDSPNSILSIAQLIFSNPIGNGLIELKNVDIVDVEEV